MKNILLPGLVSLLLLSCNKDNSTVLKGTYTEVTPVAGRTTITFSGDKMTMQSAGNAYTETAYYKIRGAEIEMIPVNQNSYATKHVFRSIDEHTFETGNLYPDVNMVPTTMTFKN